MNGMDYNNSFSRIYLTYLTQRLFNVQRFPGYEENVIYFRDVHEKKSLAHISEAEIIEHLAVLTAIQSHTQNEIRRVTGKDKIRLYRGFRGPMGDAVSLAVRRARESGDTIAHVYSNTLDFYAVKHEGFDEGASVSIDVSIKNILAAHQTINGFSTTDQDIFVVNPSSTGFFDIPLESFEVRNTSNAMWREFNQIADNCSDLNHHAIFAKMMRNYYPVSEMEKEFSYQPGLFEQKLTRWGRTLDSKIFPSLRRYGWVRKK